MQNPKFENKPSAPLEKNNFVEVKKKKTSLVRMLVIIFVTIIVVVALGGSIIWYIANTGSLPGQQSACMASGGKWTLCGSGCGPETRASFKADFKNHDISEELSFKEFEKRYWGWEGDLSEYNNGRPILLGLDRMCAAVCTPLCNCSSEKPYWNGWKCTR